MLRKIRSISYDLISSNRDKNISQQNYKQKGNQIQDIDVSPIRNKQTEKLNLYLFMGIYLILYLIHLLMIKNFKRIRFIVERLNECFYRKIMKM